ncbi:MAG: menaquinone biosynthesis family protein [Planctomycetota bacterium]|jgi:1,4-dihydroxy-6-naphthoate synthase
MSADAVSLKPHVLSIIGDEMSDQRPILRIGHSPDPDDAFMWWPLGREGGGFDTGRFRYEPVLRDIESLNCAAEAGELEITAISCAQYARVADRYALTSCGSSLGDQYGPQIVSRQPMTTRDLQRDDVVLAIPGERTSAYAALSVLLGAGSFRHAVVDFDQIMAKVAAGEFAAGLVIHEGQITFEQAGLHLVADLGMWWSSRCGLPLPLGVNVIRRDLDELCGPSTLGRVTADLRRSVQYALDHRAEALAHARQYARDLTAEQAEQFVNMYVNRWTLELGSVGRAAVKTFLRETHRAGLSPDPGEVDVIGPDPG